MDGEYKLDAYKMLVEFIVCSESKSIRVGPKPIHCGEVRDGCHNWPVTCREGEYQCEACKLREQLRELKISQREGA